MPDTEAVEKSPEQIKQEEVEKRIGEFMLSYKALVDEKKVDFASYPVWMPDGHGGFQCVIQSTPMDVSNVPVRSNFIPDNN